jgi:NADH-quinone oxidoreductase subunit F
VALRNCGRVDPGSLDDYLAGRAGYSGLERALKLGPEGVIAELESAGLRGRGGAGYPTAQKWRACREAEGGEKFAVCNALDADPHARTARLLLGGDPHSVLEGLLIGAYTVGAARGFVCVNAEYTEEIAAVEQALEQMRARGLLGDDIRGSGFACDFEVRALAGSLVAGEETALIRALEGRQPLPYLRFDYPAVNGLHNKPTLVNSAETLANVSAILQEETSVARAGVLESGGTKIVTVTGAVSQESTVEIPLGTTIGALLEAVVGDEAGAAQGVAPGASAAGLGIKAVQFGGPVGAFFAGASLATPIAYEDLEAAGSVMGSATLRVFGGAPGGALDKDASNGVLAEGGAPGSSGALCAVELARNALAYLHEESCGICTACREGTLQLAEMLDDLVESRAKPEDRDLMLELCEHMHTGSICGLGKNAANPLLSLLQLFSDDFDAHFHGQSCPASGSGAADGEPRPATPEDGGAVSAKE